MIKFTRIFFLLLSVLCFSGKVSGKDVYTLEYSGSRNMLFRNGKVLTFADCAEEMQERHLDYSVCDMVEQVFQGAFGAGFVSFDRIQQRQMIMDDFASVKAADVPLFEIISPDYCRINLAAWKFHKLPVDWLFNIYCASAEVFPDSRSLYLSYLDVIASENPAFSKDLKKTA